MRTASAQVIGSLPPAVERPLALRDASSDAADAGTGAGQDSGDAASPLDPLDDPMSLHRETKEELLALFSIKDFTADEKKRIMPEDFLSRMFATTGPSHSNQGNKAIAKHTISKRACLKGLEGVVLQTDAQKSLCGSPNMVPVSTTGKPPYYCIDIFEFPNQPCELPVVWTSPTFAKKTCELQGKRLCSQVEWDLACRSDPAGGPDQRYAYGDKLDLEACHTSRPHRQACDPTSAGRAWATCTTDSEPSGSFPKCRSRTGVYDMHGNVAEIMMRRDENNAVVSQLKGSAWFYKNIAREPGEPAKASQKGMETYPDHCNFDPRWHVEAIDNAWHVNYHLGFRCCKTIP
jgi:formylglycine-generating enzyme